MPLPYQSPTPTATTRPGSPNLVSTTDELANQVKGKNPTYQGAYNPMYHQANQQPITMKDLASLYYKAAGSGQIGDSPTLWRTANEMNKLGLAESTDDVKATLQARIGLAGGDRQAVFDQLADQVNARHAKNEAKIAGLKPEEAEALRGAAPGGNAGSLGVDVMQNWMDQYVDPYVAEQTAMLDFQAKMFDSVVADIIPTMDPGKAEIMKAYFPLISAAYHQKAATFANDFISGNDSTSLICQLMKNSKRNANVLKFLESQNGVGSGGDVSGFMAQFGLK